MRSSAKILVLGLGAALLSTTAFAENKKIAYFAASPLAHWVKNLEQVSTKKSVKIFNVSISPRHNMSLVALRPMNWLVVS